jgi:hypothetical protein
LIDALDSESIAIPKFDIKNHVARATERLKNEEACGNKRKPLRINGEKHDEMLLPITPLSVLISLNGTLMVRIHDGEKQK